MWHSKLWSVILKERGRKSYKEHPKGNMCLERGGGWHVGMTQVFFFRTNSEHCFLPPPWPIVLGTKAKDFPGQGEMERMMDQRRGRMTHFFLYNFEFLPYFGSKNERQRAILVQFWVDSLRCASSSCTPGLQQGAGLVFKKLCTETFLTPHMMCVRFWMPS